ncbi:hypothetical protein EZV62_021093 [Acer yangbiense]|uniref:Bidirectional sugar transporter SWEET n=1 Tax=Acer yangbiense TaxID=1000413 RepID=A0A5C7H4I5_9ROSI|nr:hypothetical protein EZV62_021093 [Acer yangbiense]
MEIPHFIFGFLFFFFCLFVTGNATALFLFLAPVITFKRIIRSKSTEQFSGIPYVMTLLNNLLAAWYGLPFVSENNILVSTINGTGAVIESIYVLIFIIYATKKEKAKIFGLVMFILSVFAVVALVSLLALHGNTRKIFCGFATAIFAIIMYASPLSVVMMVIKTKSVEFMPFFLSLFVFLCGSSWFIFGLLGRDPFIAVSPKWTWVWDGNSAVDILLHLPQQGLTKETRSSIEWTRSRKIPSEPHINRLACL